MLSTLITLAKSTINKLRVGYIIFSESEIQKILDGDKYTCLKCDIRLTKPDAVGAFIKYRNKYLFACKKENCLLEITKYTGRADFFK